MPALLIMLAGCGGGGGGGAGAGAGAGAGSSAAVAEPVSTAVAPTSVGSAVPDEAAAVAAATLKTYQTGAMVYLERDGSTGHSRIGMDTRRGGMITEASLNGVNFINSNDTGRGVQTALYDGAYRYDACAGCGGTWGWNPVQGGDRLNQGSTVLSTRVDADAIVVRTRALQWMVPGAAVGSPVASDVVMEHRITPVDHDARGFRVDFRVDYSGDALHLPALQELPGVYAAAEYNRLIAYSGTAPWTSAAVSATTPSLLGQLPARRYSPELWFALVNANDMGVSVFAPGSSPYVSGFLAPGSTGPTGSGAAFARLDTPLAIEPGKVIVGHYYLFVGDYKGARESIYKLKAAGDSLDLSAPSMALDRPVQGGIATGMLTVAGWAYDSQQLASIDIFVDGVSIGRASTGGSRPDVAAAIEGAPPDSGFGKTLDTLRWPNGRHTVKAVATDAAGNQNEAQADVDILN